MQVTEHGRMLEVEGSNPFVSFCCYQVSIIPCTHLHVNKLERICLTFHAGSKGVIEAQCQAD